MKRNNQEIKCPCEECILLAICINKNPARRFQWCGQLYKYLYFYMKKGLMIYSFPREDYAERSRILYKVLKHPRWDVDRYPKDTLMHNINKAKAAMKVFFPGSKYGDSNYSGPITRSTAIPFEYLLDS